MLRPRCGRKLSEATRPWAHTLTTHRGRGRLLVGASVASLLSVGFALSLAGRESGAQRLLLIGVAVLTVMLSWTGVNTIYSLRYADLHFGSRAAGIGFGDSVGQERPNYRDFAYVAFTIGRTYQVSDTTVRDPRIRRIVLSHAVLSNVFGVVIVGGAVNLVAGLVHRPHRRPKARRSRSRLGAVRSAGRSMLTNAWRSRRSGRSRWRSRSRTRAASASGAWSPRPDGRSCPVGGVG